MSKINTKYYQEIILKLFDYKFQLQKIETDAEFFIEIFQEI